MVLHRQEFDEEQPTLLEQRVESAGITVASKGKLGTMDINDIRQKAKDAVKDIPSEILTTKHQPKSAKYIRDYILDFVLNCRNDLSEQLLAVELRNIANEVIDDILGYGPIQALLMDPDVTEIIVAGPGPGKIRYEKHGDIHYSDVFFRDKNDIMDVIEKIISPINRRIDEKKPSVDARLPDGSRVHAIIPPIAPFGPCLTIRKFKKNFGISDMIKFGAITEKDAELLDAFIKTELSMIISGGTGSGKTTVLNALSEFIPEKTEIITIEDSLELQLKQKCVRALETRQKNLEGEGEVTMRDCVKDALRMKVRWLIIGEVRDGAAFDMLSALNTGHCGLTTVHSNSAQDCLVRLETLCRMGADLPVDVIRTMISACFNIILQTKQFKDGSRKLIQISEIAGMDGNKLILQDILVYNPKSERLELTGVKPLFLEQMINCGVNPPEWLLKEGGW